MFQWVVSVLAFGRMVLREYVVSGRIVVELLAVCLFTLIFFWPQGRDSLSLERFMTIAGPFLVLLSVYTAVRVVRLGGQPQGLVFVLSPLRRHGFLAGLHGVAAAIGVLVYGALVVVVSVLYRSYGQPIEIGVRGWVVGGLPLLLDVVVVVALVLFLSQVFPFFERLVVRAVVGAGVLLLVLVNVAPGEQATTLVGQVVQVPRLLFLQSVALAMQPVWTLAGAGVLLIQAVLAVGLLAGAMVLFNRRDVALRPG